MVKQASQEISNQNTIHENLNTDQEKQHEEEIFHNQKFDIADTFYSHQNGYRGDTQKHRPSQKDAFSAVVNGIDNAQVPKSDMSHKNLENTLKAVARTSKPWVLKEQHIKRHIETSNPKVVIFGDSIIANLKKSYFTTSRSWKRAKIALSGIHGDRVENVLQRIETTSFPNSVKSIYLAVGTHNIFRNTPEEIVNTLISCLKVGRTKVP